MPTGVVAMLLLQLAGVADADIVADYAVSEIYMREFVDKYSQGVMGAEVPLHVLRSIPDSMWRVLEHLHNTHGGAEAYLRKQGLSAAEIGAIRDRFVERWTWD